MFDHRREFKDTTVSHLKFQYLHHFEADPFIQLTTRIGGIKVCRDIRLARNLKGVLHQLSANSMALIRRIYADKLDNYRYRYP